ncbi:MAG TPA: helix-turn-helix transcriptional regulator [Streptosporangiaceae bacterium]|nr:helix-turn-helix transcriptional regulator [Streptosporangiaceae bacterium]
MAPSSSPTVRRRRLAAELHRLRQASKLTIEQVAEALEWSPGKVSKIENARVSVLPRDARKLLDLYGVPEGQERELLLALARESRERGWWQQYGEAVPEWFATYVGLEAEAVTISTYQAEIVPGLLQTRRYAAALHRAELMNASDEEIERHVAVRMQRQERLTQPDAPRLWVVLNEAVIRRTVGERAVMHEQLVKLVEAADAPNITLQVLPFSAGAHASMDSAFSIIGFDPPTDGEIVYFEHPTCSLYLEKADEVARYRLVYEHLRASSLSMDESRRLLTRAAEDMA